MGEEAVDILVIEDDPNHAEQTARALAKSGIPAHVRVIDDSVAALDYPLGTPDGVQAAPRVILLDLNLPRVSGIEVLRRLRDASATRTIPVVVLSTSLEARDLRDCGSATGWVLTAICTNRLITRSTQP